MRRFNPGERVEMREVWRGKTWELRPAIVVHDDVDLIALLTPPGEPAQTPLRADGTRMRLPKEEWTLGPVLTYEEPVLGLHVPGTDHSVLLVWEADWSPRDWYINLESDLLRTNEGFECDDRVLDVVVAPDMSTWLWKDEDELEEAVEIGLFTQEQAAEFRAEGKRALEWLLSRRPPYDRDWLAWRPPPEWGVA